jgi:hypothetical protein
MRKGTRNDEDKEEMFNKQCSMIKVQGRKSKNEKVKRAVSFKLQAARGEW